MQHFFAVALTDGKAVLVDIDLRPKLNHKGIVCANKSGEWSVKCVSHNTEQNKKLAGIVCFSLGFSAPAFFNLSRVDANGAILHKHNPPSHARNAYYEKYLPWRERQTSGFGHGIYKRSMNTDDLPHQMESYEIMIAAPNPDCNAIYLECVPHSLVPIDDPVTPPVAPATVIPGPTIPLPDAVNPQAIVPSSDIHPQIHPATNSTPQSDALSPVSHKNETAHRVIDENFSAPWIASVYIDGTLMCIGVLLDRQWILAENDCVESAEYVEK